MPMYDHARYVGPDPEFAGQEATIRPHFDTHHLPLEERKVLVQWHNPNLTRVADGVAFHVGNAWHDMPAEDFRILVRV